MWHTHTTDLVAGSLKCAPYPSPSSRLPPTHVYCCPACRVPVRCLSHDIYLHKHTHACPAGVGWVRLSTPLGEADVFNTHLHANYCHDYRLPAPDLRRAAAAAAAKLAKGASPAAVSKAAAEAMVRGTGPAPEWAGSRMPDDDDAGVRMCQLMELSEIIDLVTSSGSSSSSTSSSGGRSSSEGRLIVLGGDLNCKPHTLEIDLLRLRLPQLSDAWAAAAVRSSSVVDDSTAAAGRQSGSRVVSSSGDNDDDDDDDADGSSSSSKLLGINPEGFTCHAPGNTFQPRRQVPERIDYVWSNMVTHKAQVTLQLCPSAGGGSSKQQLLSYSDHFAVRAVLSKHAAGGGSGSAGGSGKTSPVGAMKLISNALGQSTGGASAAAAAATTEAAGAAAQGEGASMPMPQKVATAYAAMLLLQEGFESFVNNRRAMLSLGGFILASLIYVAVGLPILWPDLVLTGPAITAAVAAAAAVTVLGLILVLMGAVGDKSQERAIQSGLRLLRVWMEQQGFAALPQQPQQELVARGETERAVAVQQH